jgi:hypothetical protein
MKYVYIYMSNVKFLFSSEIAVQQYLLYSNTCYTKFNCELLEVKMWSGAVWTRVWFVQNYEVR